MVVVVEDELLIRMAVVEILSEAGFLVLEAEHAEKALAILKIEAHGVHVLFTDVRMPGEMDVVALSHHVKANWPWISLLVTSAHASLTEEDLPPGSRFITKPYHHAHVIDHVRELAAAA